ncbi:alpha/beta hydrolase [Streptomyces sp. NBC_00401]|uniref:alpha/beta hydrolase n=1 Tax=unclassified Streptomyces TaxID=2593676 RepID=UPI001D0B67E3|nr:MULTISPECIES: alpha/beta hydrolase [Streptomyces]MCX5084219.1 alpha/beta hydrolase [Streptomyces sp. NBC_00401]UDM05356.1 alpha/beta hydrolase [Streptomyces longhuiensis]
MSSARAGDLGHWWAWANEPCATWPAQTATTCTGPWHTPTAHPILVINPTYDPATSYREGRAMARELTDARLLTLNGYGLTALDNPSTWDRQPHRPALPHRCAPRSRRIL